MKWIEKDEIPDTTLTAGCVDMLLLTWVPEILEIDNDGVGVECGPDQDQVLLRPISAMKSGLLREREMSLVAGGSTTTGGKGWCTRLVHCKYTARTWTKYLLLYYSDHSGWSQSSRPPPGAICHPCQWSLASLPPPRYEPNLAPESGQKFKFLATTKRNPSQLYHTNQTHE